MSAPEPGDVIDEQPLASGRYGEPDLGQKPQQVRNSRPLGQTVGRERSPHAVDPALRIHHHVR